ncbi:MAG: ChaN family lipoprotein [Defluviicoccus sp.]|nr:ChaN family lipoprotein [Defluviicoccus sp.]MDS4073325.1 ChaN family lipoprotein [Defluviicoccus sp.]
MPAAMTPAVTPRASRPQPLLSRSPRRPAQGALAACVIALALSACTSDRSSGCAPAGRWIDPATGQTVAADGLLAGLATRPIVLLGEEHDNAAHHRWQLSVIEALYARRPDLVLGFEMFARASQPVLDQWVAGEIDADQFLLAARWKETWGFDPQLYLPIFEFARRHKLPMRALNVERSLIRRVAREGLSAVPSTEREGIGDPAPALPAYRRWLGEVFAHKRAPHGDQAAAAPDPAFERFVAAQLTWDRAMAEALAAAHAQSETRLVVGIAGIGHLQNGWGIPHQLRDLGIVDAAVLLPVAAGTACAELPAGFADAVFAIE